MIKYCLLKWDANKHLLQEALAHDKKWQQCDYTDLVVAIVNYILNPEIEGIDNYEYDPNKITTIDNGDFQGTLLFTIPEDSYQPSANEYLITFIEYGSCTVCDTLQSIQDNWDNWDDYLTEQQIKDFMSLCKDIVMNITKPYNRGWRNKELFEEVQYKKEEE